MRLFLFILILWFPFSLWGVQEFTINLKDPEYQGGVISTHQGGVISSPELRIQARHIVYINKVEKGKQIHQVVAEGDLMLESGGRTYVGKRLEYDFITKTGIVYEGVTAIDLWFLGAFTLTPKETSRLLIEAYETLAESHEMEGIDLLIEAIRLGHKKNRYALAGLLLKAIQ